MTRPAPPAFVTTLTWRYAPTTWDGFATPFARTSEVERISAERTKRQKHDGGTPLIEVRVYTPKPSY